MIDASKLDRRLQILRRSSVTDASYGTADVTWVVWKTVWASVIDFLPSRADRVPDGISIADRPARIRIRYLAGITNDMRLRVDGRTLQITAGPAELGRHRDMEIVATEITTTGDAR